MSPKSETSHVSSILEPISTTFTLRFLNHCFCVSRASARLVWREPQELWTAAASSSANSFLCAWYAARSSSVRSSSFSSPMIPVSSMMIRLAAPGSRSCARSMSLGEARSQPEQCTVRYCHHTCVQGCVCAVCGVLSRTARHRSLCRDPLFLTPQVEVTFEIDSKGILYVGAKDKGTGRAKKIIRVASRRSKL